MRECEEDHRIGATEILELQGAQYILYLKGERWCGPRDVGSGYHTANPDHYWYEGMGKVSECVTGKEKVFSFATWKEECGRNRSFRNFILISDRWDFGYQEELPVIESQLPALIDLRCELILKKISTTEALPDIGIGRISYEELVAKGFVPDKEGQIHLHLTIS